jgi:hypothetical protein
MSVEKLERKRSTVRSTVRKLLETIRSWVLWDLRARTTDTQFLLGKMAAWQVRSQKVISSLHDIEFKVTSQWGEDGIIDWLVERAKIPVACHTFVEFGVETYREANTRFLLQNRNWRGLIMDGSPDLLPAVKTDGLYWKHDLTAKIAFITRENINELISSAGFSGDIGLLSIDLDGNDYWVWEAISAVRPIICICEYNAVFGDVYPISVPYNPTFFRTDAHSSNLYFGASIAALRSLASQKGYRFVGTTSAANDAFFVREDYAQRFVDASVLDIQALPSAARESVDQSGALTYVTGINRLEHIKAMSVVNVQTGETVEISQLGSVYSTEWMEKMSTTLVKTQ